VIIVWALHNVQTFEVSIIVKDLRGRTTSGILSAAIYIACRELETPKTLKDILAVSTITRRDTTRSYRQLVFELDLKIPVVDPMKCIARVANRAHLSEMAKRQAISIMHAVRKAGLSDGKNPMGLAATVLYASCVKVGESITQADIARAAAVTEVTLRNRFKDLKNHLIGTNYDSVL